MELTRREFLKICTASAVGAGISQVVNPKLIAALEEVATTKPPVIWLQGANCTGCAVSLLNTSHPTIAEVLLKIISLEYCSTIMAASGELAFTHLEMVTEKAKGKYILAVEGAVPTKDNGIYCTLGEKDGKEVTLLELLNEIAPKAAAILAIGNCASFGGIPAAKPNPTGCKPVSEIVKGVPIINLQGCPPHPDWMVGTIAHVLLFGLPALDDKGRPKLFYSETVHQNCPNYSYFQEGKMAKKFGDKGCLIELGCKGPMAYSDCPLRKWNSGVNWCIGVGSPCIGCSSDKFPDSMSPFYSALPKDKWPAKDSEIA
ncbi:MAG: hydrogenase small subunit [Candidatus Omnitrophica bacterium]|nr:hydrogenase small subunit [Candidatus Omnitrophota bacterium]